jgi:hypothetical protein
MMQSSEDWERHDPCAGGGIVARAGNRDLLSAVLIGGEAGSGEGSRGQGAGWVSEGGWGSGGTNSQRRLILGLGGCEETGALVVEDDFGQHTLARVV